MNYDATFAPSVTFSIDAIGSLKQIDGINRPAAHVAVAAMGPLGIVRLGQPSRHPRTHRTSEGWPPRKLLLDRADEALDVAVGLMLGKKISHTSKPSPTTHHTPHKTPA